MTHQTVSVELADLTLDPSNARRHPTRNMEAVKASLARFGQRQVVVIQKAGMVVRAGNARVLAARELGWSHIAGIVIDENDIEAMAYALADNRSSELAEWDLPNLSGALSALLEANIDPEVLGWPPDEVEMLLGVEWEPMPLPDLPGGDIDSPGDDDLTRAPLTFTLKQWEAIERSVERLRSMQGYEAMTVSQSVVRVAELWLEQQ